jgi:hypothetical protein
MALAPLGVPDLTIVTDTLLGLLGNFLNAAGATSVRLSGSTPDSVRARTDGCQMTFSLFHVSENMFLRNSPPPPNRRAQTIPAQPMSLNLHYLLTAFNDQDYAQEQLAMSLAIQFFYQNPIVKTQVLLPGIGTPVDEEFTLTMETEPYDQLSRLWQAVTVPMRLSALYRVSVVLLTPPATAAPAKPVLSTQLAVNPTLFPFTSSGQIAGTSRTFTFATPLSTPATPVLETVSYSPAVMAPGQRLIIHGANLNLTDVSDRVFLIDATGAESEVTAWKTEAGLPDEGIFQTDSLITLDLPSTVGALPSNSPAPGIYQLQAGNIPATGTPNRTNSVPFSVAPRIDVPVLPPNAPLLSPSSGNYTINGDGFLAQQTRVLVDTTALAENTAGPPADGEFTLSSPQQLVFRVPTGLSGGPYMLRVRVNGVESPPSWWVVIP